METKYARVVPLVRLKRGLNYFDYVIPPELDICPGALVEVNFRNKPIAGVVIGIADSPEKPSIALKTISQLLDPDVSLASWQIELITWISDYYYTSMSAVAQMMVPDIPKRQKTSSVIPSLPRNPSRDVSTVLDMTIKPILIKYASEDKKIEFIKSIIAKNRDAGTQTLIIAPLLTDVEELQESLKEFSPLAFLPSLAKGSYYTAWKHIKNNNARVIIGTRSALFAPCLNLGAIIIDHEESEHHKQEEPNPRYNTKTVAAQIQRRTGCALIHMSQAPSLLSLHTVALKTMDYRELDTPLVMNEVTVIDFHEEYKRKNFSVISERLKEELAGALTRKEKSFLFLNRKGTAGALMCTDCGYLFVCERCALPFTYYAERGLVCHHCEREKDAPVSCPQCRGARLKPRGTGTEKVEEELKKLFPAARILKLDLDSPLEPEDHHPLVEAADIIIGTVYAFPFMKWETVGLVGVISADSLLHLPDYRSAERSFSLLYRLVAVNSTRQKTIIVQTHIPESHIFTALKNHSIRDFYAREVEDRKLLNYPPFSKLIRLIISDPDRHAGQRKARELYESLTRSLDRSVAVFPPIVTHVQRIRGNYRWHILLKLPVTIRSTVPALLNLDESIIIDVDPETLV